MKRILHSLILLAVSGLLFSHTPPEPSRQPVVKLPRLETGDLVFRTGEGLISEMFRETSARDKRYSHVGMVVRTGAKIRVAHIIGDPENSRSRIRMESIGKFCRAGSGAGFAIYRIEGMHGNDTRVRDFINEAIGRNVEFDDAFSFESDNRWYCTEMVYKTIRHATGLCLPRRTFTGKTYVALDDLYLNARAHQILQYP